MRIWRSIGSVGDVDGFYGVSAGWEMTGKRLERRLSDSGYERGFRLTERWMLLRFWGFNGWLFAISV